MFWSRLFRPARPGYRTPYQRPHRTRQSKLGSLHPQAAKTAPRRLDSVPMPVRRTPPVQISRQQSDACRVRKDRPHQICCSKRNPAVQRRHSRLDYILPSIRKCYTRVSPETDGTEETPVTAPAVAFLTAKCPELRLLIDENSALKS